VRQFFAGGSGLLIGLFALTAVLVAIPAAPQFTSYSRDSRNILEGSWQ